jgi:hypothetical protein
LSDLSSFLSPYFPFLHAFLLLSPPSLYFRCFTR